MSFAAKIVDSIKSVRAYFTINVSNNQGILVTSLVQTEADFRKLKTGCENVIGKHFMDYPTFAASHAAVIECDVRILNYFDLFVY